MTACCAGLRVALWFVGSSWSRLEEGGRELVLCSSSLRQPACGAKEERYRQRSSQKGLNHAGLGSDRGGARRRWRRGFLRSRGKRQLRRAQRTERSWRHFLFFQARDRRGYDGGRLRPRERKARRRE